MYTNHGEGSSLHKDSARSVSILRHRCTYAFESGPDHRGWSRDFAFVEMALLDPTQTNE